eukprot:819195-Ditylum_brightwellii.AAC.1
MGLKKWIPSVGKHIMKFPDLKAQVYYLESINAPSNPTLCQLLGESRQVEDCDPDPTMRVNIEELLVQVKLLQGRSSGERVHLERENFGSFPELLIFTKTKLPNHHFGLVVGTNSFAEFILTDTSKSIEEFMTTMHGSAKNNFASMFKSQVDTAAQNALPTIFGCAKQDVDMSVYLPGIFTLKHWDATEDQLSAAISIVLADYTEAYTHLKLDQGIFRIPITPPSSVDSTYGPH